MGLQICEVGLILFWLFNRLKKLKTQFFRFLLFFSSFSSLVGIWDYKFVKLGVQKTLPIKAYVFFLHWLCLSSNINNLNFWLLNLFRFVWILVILLNLCVYMYMVIYLLQKFFFPMMLM